MSRRSDNVAAPNADLDACCDAAGDSDAVARAKARLVSDVRVARTVRIFSALADPTRLRILDALAGEELCVCDLAAVCWISQSGVSHQLRLLRDGGLVAFRRESNRAVYCLADDHVRVLLAVGLEHADEPQDAPR